MKRQEKRKVAVTISVQLGCTLRVSPLAARAWEGSGQHDPGCDHDSRGACSMGGAGIYMHTRGEVGDSVMRKMYSYSPRHGGEREPQQEQSPPSEPLGSMDQPTGKSTAPVDGTARSVGASSTTPSVAKAGTELPSYMAPRSAAPRWTDLLEMDEVRAAVTRGVSARELRDEVDKTAYDSVRAKARWEQQAAAGEAEEAPIPTLTPKPVRWRKKPLIDSEGEAKNETHDLWTSLFGDLSLSSTAAPAPSAKERLRARREKREERYRGKATQLQPDVLVPVETGPPRPSSPPQLYGSARPLSAKELGYQEDKSMERQARRYLADLKAQAKEALAKEELRSKQRRVERLRAKETHAKSARGAMKTAERKAVQDRLCATPSRQGGRVYG